MKLPAPRYTVTDVKHKYTISMPNGENIGPLKSVTGVLGVIAKPALIVWSARESANYFKTQILRLGRGALDPAILEQIATEAAGAHRRKAKDAADLGTLCHKICEDIILGNEPEVVPQELTEAVIAFKKWRLASDFSIVTTEIAVASVEHRYGGRLDAVGYSKSRGGFGVIDIKTSRSLKFGNEYPYQVGGYAAALAEQYGVQVTWAEIIRLGKAAPFDSEACPITDMSAAISGFMAALALFRAEETKLIGEPTFTSIAAILPELVSQKKKNTVSSMGF